MARVARVGHAHEPFGEKDFYLEEFRGRSVLVAVSPLAAAARPDLAPLVTAVADLVRNDTRVLVWWPMVAGASDRRLLYALGRAVPARGRRAATAPVERVDAGDLFEPGAERLRGVLWMKLRRERTCVVAERNATRFPEHAVTLALLLRVPKLVLADPAGGLLADGRSPFSFVDENVLETLLREGEAEWSGLGDRRDLLVAVGEALRGGVESVNLCTPEGIAEELFTYAGSGTLFTRGDYCHVGPLGLDDFAQAERLLERGQREGLLKFRTPAEIAAVLAVGFGATLFPHHLAGVAGLLTAPYTRHRAGEVVGLYTITRFKGEGIGDRLVVRLLAEAEQRDLAYVFACAVDERAQQFFARHGFARVGHDQVPAAKWENYEARRRARVAVLRYDLPRAPAGRA
jgi:amino-acid N-acetyltransferase